MLKPNQLTKILMCGLMASTFFLVNCQKSSDRSVRAQMNKVNDKATPKVFAPCTEKANDYIKKRQDLLIEMNKIIAESEVRELDSAQKTSLQKMVIDLKPLSDSLIAEIKSIKSGTTARIAGCSQTDPKNQSKKINHEIATISLMDLTIAKKVAAITKQTNSIVEAHKNDQDEVEKTTVIEQQGYSVSAEFAAAMTDSKKDGNMYISEGKINDSSSAKEDMKKIIAENKVSVCYLELSSGQLKEKDKITIKIINSKVAADAKSATMRITFVGEEDRLNSLACVLNKTTELNTEARKVFGDLIKLESASK